MRAWALAAALALVSLDVPRVVATEPRPVFMRMDAERFDISGDGNSLTGLRRAPVPYDSLSDVGAAVRQAQTLATGLAVLLAACAGPTRARVDMPEPTPAAAPVAKPQPAPEPPRQADQLARIASELAELQNAMAKLMMSARQHDDQLLYLQRRLGDVENQMRGRGQAAPTLPPSAAVPAPLPPPPLAGPPLVTPPTTT